MASSTDTTVTLAFAAPTGGLTPYTHTLQINSGTGWSDLAAAVVPEENILVEGLDPDTSYTFRVKTQDSLSPRPQTVFSNELGVDTDPEPVFDPDLEFEYDEETESWNYDVILDFQDVEVIGNRRQFRQGGDFEVIEGNREIISGRIGLSDPTVEGEEQTGYSITYSTSGGHSDDNCAENPDADLGESPTTFDTMELTYTRVGGLSGLSSRDVHVHLYHGSGIDDFSIFNDTEFGVFLGFGDSVVLQNTYDDFCNSNGVSTSIGKNGTCTVTRRPADP